MPKSIVGQQEMTAWHQNGKTALVAYCMLRRIQGTAGRMKEPESLFEYRRLPFAHDGDSFSRPLR
jgi:hypothetical protein